MGGVKKREADSYQVQFDTRALPAAKCQLCEYLSHSVGITYQYTFGSEGSWPGQFQSPEQICITPADGLVCVTYGEITIIIRAGV